MLLCPVSNLSFFIISTVLSLLSLIVEAFVLNDSEPFKIASYVALSVWIIRTGYYLYDQQEILNNQRIIEIVTYGIMALLNFSLFLMKFYKTKGKNEEDINICFVLDAFNFILMVYGIIMMYRSKINIFKIIYTVIVLILACKNIPSSFPLKDIKNEDLRKNVYLYTSMKFAFLLCYSLWVFNTSSLVISIYMITYAVVCIILGFRYRMMGKSFRIFGLVMTLVFVIKIIVIDISFESSILRAISYLVNGILCFGISAIYNYFEKKTVDKYKTL
jgi:hypothetical protein